MHWPFAILLVLLGIFLLRFAMSSSGALHAAQQLGALACFVAALRAWQVFGWSPWFVWLAFFLLVVLPIIEIVLARVFDGTDKYWV